MSSNRKHFLKQIEFIVGIYKLPMPKFDSLVSGASKCG